MSSSRPKELQRRRLLLNVKCNEASRCLSPAFERVLFFATHFFAGLLVL